MKTRTYLSALSLACVLSLFPALLKAEEPPAANSADQLSAERDAHSKKVRDLALRIKNAANREEKDALNAQLRSLLEERSQKIAQERETRKAAQLEELKKDPYRLELFQLQEGMRNAKTPEERETIKKKMSDLRARRSAEEEARLSPEERATRAEKAKRGETLDAETKPLYESLKAAKTEEERRVLLEKIKTVREKYRRPPAAVPAQ